jgi:hypothetical protein
MLPTIIVNDQIAVLVAGFVGLIGCNHNIESSHGIQNN